MIKFGVGLGVGLLSSMSPSRKQRKTNSAFAYERPGTPSIALSLTGWSCIPLTLQKLFASLSMSALTELPE